MASNYVPPFFTVAPFAIDGAPEGQAKWSVTDLSPKWIDLCSRLIVQNGAIVDHSLDGPLSHLRVQCAYGNGAALITIAVHGRPVSMAAFASGNSSAADMDTLAMFAATIAQASAGFHKSNDRAFSALPAIADRPLLTVVPWPDDLISDQEHALARELMLHFTAALLLHASR